jgi:hypothetical protein
VLLKSIYARGILFKISLFTNKKAASGLTEAAVLNCF